MMRRAIFLGAGLIVSATCSRDVAAQGPSESPKTSPIPESASRIVAEPAPRVDVRIGPRAVDGVALADRRSGVSIAFSVESARAVAMTPTPDGASARGAGPSSSDLRVERIDDGVKDSITFHSRPALREVTYRVDVSHVAGVRVAQGVVEYLDATGAPRLRTARPRMVDALGRTQWARVDVRGCRHDRATTLPWGRPVVSPGAHDCRVVVRWDDRQLSYPVVLDPLWTTTDAMAVPRVWHAATLLRKSKTAAKLAHVLVTGGQDDRKQPVTLVEVFDPNTNTWATGPHPIIGRYLHTATELDDGGVLVAGGYDANRAALRSTERVLTDGVILPEPDLPTGRAEHTATKLEDGTVVVIGGGTTAPVTYHPGPPSSSWTVKCVSCIDPTTRYGHTASLILGNIYVVGGSVVSNGAPTAKTLAYSITQDTLTTEPDAPNAHVGHSATELRGYRLLVVGGAHADVFTATQHAWTEVKTPSITRQYHSATFLPSEDTDHDAVLFAGGYYGTTTHSSTSLYVPGADQWIDTPLVLRDKRMFHTATLLDDEQRILVAGGRALTSKPLATVESHTVAKTGEACAADDDCQSRACGLGGICCEKPCAECETCLASEGATRNGVCTPLADETACTKAGVAGTCRGRVCEPTMSRPNENDAAASNDGGGNGADGGNGAGGGQQGPVEELSPFHCSSTVVRARPTHASFAFAALVLGLLGRRARRANRLRASQRSVR